MWCWLKFPRKRRAVRRPILARKSISKIRWRKSVASNRRCSGSKKACPRLANTLRWWPWTVENWPETVRGRCFHYRTKWRSADLKYFNKMLRINHYENPKQHKEIVKKETTQINLPKHMPTRPWSKVIKIARTRFPWHGMLKIKSMHMKTNAVWPIITVHWLTKWPIKTSVMVTPMKEQ